MNFTINKRWFPAIFTTLLTLIIAIGFLTMPSYTAGTDSALEPNSKNNPYELAYGETIALKSLPDNKRKGQTWFAYPEKSGTYQLDRTGKVTNKNSSNTAKSLIIEHYHNAIPGQSKECYYIKLLPPVHYKVVLDDNNEGETVTGMPQSPIDAWEKKDGKVVVTIPNIKPVRTGKVFAGWAKNTMNNPEVMPGGTFAFEEDETYNNEITLYALWYYTATVRYSAEKNGSVSLKNENAYIYTMSGIQGSTAIGNNGYECEGWYKGGRKIADGPTLTPAQIIANMDSHQEGDQTAYEDTTFTAKFKPIEYTITYDLDGGVESVFGANRTTYTVETAEFYLNTPYKKGFECLGWTGTGLDQPTLYPHILKGSTGNRKYKANWERITEWYCFVEFVDGLGKTLDSQMLQKGEAAVAPADPTRDGYIFDGWDTDFSNVTSDLTVTARWKQAILTHQVVFEDGQGNVLATQTVVDGRPATAPEDPTRDGFIFSGWDTDFSCVTSDMTVKAMWTKQSQEKDKYTVVFVIGFGLDPISQVINKGESATAPAVPDVDGFTFAGWDKPFTNVTDHLKVAARWKKNTAANAHTVVFVDGYSYNPLLIQRVRDGASAKPPADPTREGYTFDGWDMDFSYVTSNLTVIARWKQNYTPPTPASDPARVTAAPTARSLTYTGSAQELVTAGQADGGIIQYALGTAAEATESYTTSIPTAMNAGIYYVWYHVKGDENHTDTAAASPVEVVISPRSLNGAAVTLDKTQLTYNGSEQSVNVTGVVIDGLHLGADDYDVTGNRGTDRNGYSVTVTGKGNFKDHAVAGWRIVDKAMVVSAENVTVPYDGKEHGILVTVIDPAGGATVRYGRTEGNYDLETSPTITDPGTLIVYYLVTAENYPDYTGVAVVTVKKDDSTSGETKPDGTAPEEKKSEETKQDETKQEEAKQEESRKTNASISINSKFKLSSDGDRITAEWGKVKGATSYEVRFKYCGSGKWKTIKTLGSGKTRYTFSSIGEKKLNPKKCVNIYIRAYNGSKLVAKTIVGHVAHSKNKTYTNVKKIEVSRNGYTLKVGRTKRLQPELVLKDRSKKKLDARKHKTKDFRYASSDPSVATVNKNGKIKAVGKGKCYIWIYAINGCGRKVRVTVK